MAPAAATSIAVAQLSCVRLCCRRFRAGPETFNCPPSLPDCVYQSSLSMYFLEGLPRHSGRPSTARYGRRDIYIYL